MSVAHKAAPVMLGLHDNSNDYRYVGAMSIGESGCSGTLVTPAYVLTAAHCVHDVQAIAKVNFRYEAFDSEPTPNPYYAVHTHNKAGPIHVRIAESDMSEWVDDNIAKDMALVQLDVRMPSSVVSPLHVPGIGPDPIPLCSLTMPMDDFMAILVGFGGGDWLRKYGLSGGWMREGALEGALYQNAFLASSYIGGMAYGASEGGDSGGLLLSPSGQLCGVISGHIGGMQWGGLPEGWVPVVWTNTAAVDSLLSMTWLRNKLVDAGGRFIGECLPNEGDPALIDVDSDGDLLPDACDPCPWLEDTEYRKTGVIAPFSDLDHDGIADECDLCPDNPTAFWEWDPDPNYPAGTRTRQPDDDGDRVGNACDRCRDSNVANNLSDFKCCDTYADCKSPGFTRCMPFNEQAFGLAAGTCASMKRCAESDDRDGDGVGDVCDNCPSNDNEFQDDADNDGVGDRCDNCPGTDDTLFHGENTNANYCFDYVDVYSKAKADAMCAAINPASECVPPHNGFLAVCTKGPDSDLGGPDGIGDACDNCKYVRNSKGGPDVFWPGPNCNIDSEKAEGQISYPYIGDACDREPCAWIRSWSNTGWALPPDIWAELPYQPILLPRDAPAQNGPVYDYGNMNPTATVGARFCVCGDGNTPATANGCELNCRIKNSGYWYGLGEQPGGVGWNIPHLTGDPTSTNYAAVAAFPMLPAPATDQPASQLAEVKKRYKIWWNVSAESQAGWVAGIGTGNLGIEGVYWTHVTDLVKLPQAPALSPNLPNHYTAGFFGRGPQDLSSHDDLNVPIGPWMPGWEFHCTICPGNFDQSVLELDPIDQRLIMRTRESVLDVTRSAGPGVLPVLTGVAPGSRWLTVEEGVDVRQRNGLSVAAVAVDAASVPLVVAETPEMFVVATRPILSLMAPESQSDPLPALSPPPRSDFGAVLSATEQGVLVVGGVLTDNSPAHDLWHYTPRTGGWTQTAIKGTMPEKVLAATYRYSDRSLFVVSEIALGPTRSDHWSIEA